MQVYFCCRCSSFVCLFLNSASLCSSSCPGTCYVFLTGLELMFQHLYWHDYRLVPPRPASFQLKSSSLWSHSNSLRKWIMVLDSKVTQTVRLPGASWVTSKVGTAGAHGGLAKTACEISALNERTHKVYYVLSLKIHFLKHSAIPQI